ncbi:MAG: hypothetical protein H0V72_01880 [Bradyrhizobium sp.]|nr:hypothetical protein [Bradyrhizobium sp.]
MPLGRYFVFAGSVLLALLFLADWCMPQLAVTPARAEVDRSIIRLHSRHKWPERIVIDTSLPTIVPPPAEIAEAPPVKAPAVVRSPREAFAQVTPAQAATPAIASRPAPKRRTRAARTGGPVASYEAFGFRNAFPPGW